MITPTGNGAVCLERTIMRDGECFVNDLENRMKGKPGTNIDFAKFEENWTRMTNPYPDKPSGDAVRVAENMFRKYSGT